MTFSVTKRIWDISAAGKATAPAFSALPTLSPANVCQCHLVVHHQSSSAIRSSSSPFWHAELPQLTQLCSEPRNHQHTIPQYPPILPLFIYRQTSQPKWSKKKEAPAEFFRESWVCGETGCLCQAVLACRYGYDGKTENFCEQWKLQNESISVTVLTWKCAKVPSSRFAQTISIMHQMGLLSPTLTGVLHMNDFRVENSGENLACVKQRGWGGNGVKKSLINLLQLFLRLFHNISCYKLFAALAVSWCYCSWGKGNVKSAEMHKQVGRINPDLTLQSSGNVRKHENSLKPQQKWK